MMSFMIIGSVLEIISAYDHGVGSSDHYQYLVTHLLIFSANIENLV